MKRAIKINFKDGTNKELVLSKATAIRSDLGMLHLDKISDGKYRLTFSQDICDDFSKIESFGVIRED